MEKTVRVAEREYSKKMAELTKGFEVSEPFYLFYEHAQYVLQAVGNSFFGMESRMNEVSSTAIRIGGSNRTSCNVSIHNIG